MRNFKAGDKVRFDPNELTENEGERCFIDNVEPDNIYTVQLATLEYVVLKNHRFALHPRHFTHAT